MIRAGSQAFFRTEVRNIAQAGSPLYSPQSGVKLTLYRPDGTKALDRVDMSEESEGVFVYFFQTSTSDQEGEWEAEYEAVDTGGTGLTFRTRAFTLKK